MTQQSPKSIDWQRVIEALQTPLGVVGSLIAAVLLLSVFITVAQGEQVIRVLEAFLSLPVASVVIVFAVGVTFRKEIAQLLSGGGAKLKVGSVEVSVQPQPAIPEPAKESAESAHPLTPQEWEELDGILHNSLTGREGIRQRVEELNQELVYWRFSYLSLFLVQTTQSVLRWFAVQPNGVTRQQFHASFRWVQPSERDVILQVLLQFRLLHEDGTVSITDEGRQFLLFLDAGATARPAPAPTAPLAASVASPTTTPL